jgi:serine/threonine-protein kinase
MSRADAPTVDSSRPTGRRQLERGTSIGRYLLLDLLGEGGMGMVFKAYDPELGRAIALKLLQTADEGSSHQHDRLLREAQALARLQHPNVIAVHDVGSFRGQVFIAMEFVEGETVRAWLKSTPRTRREILDVFLAAGEGVAAAHRAGLVHRDFKPDNVMVGQDGRVRVLDFGLARAANTQSSRDSGVVSAALADASSPAEVTSAPSSPSSSSSSSTSSSGLSGEWASGRMTPQLLDTPLTHAGAIVGTPRFMAPEQTLGDPVEEPADQFSFCVSLHWALYRAFPFDDAEDALKGKLAEPPPNSGVPRWLRQVLVRGLAERPAARYPSMSALIEALRADPAEARRRRLRGALGAVAAVALVSAVAAGGLAYKARRGAAEQARLSQQFGQSVEQISAIARYAALFPLHDTRGEIEMIRSRMTELQERMNAIGPIAAGPGHEALGRGHLTLDRYDEALRELEAAWATGYRSPELAYALGMAHGKLYQRALADLRKTDDPRLDANRRGEIVRRHRDPALQYLKLAGKRGLEAPEYVEGLIALYEERYDEALVLARKAYERVGWLFEARTLEGEIHLMAGQERYWKGDVDAALKEYERAIAVFRAVTEIARSSASAWIGACRALIETGDIQYERSQSPEATVNQALSACGAAATARPDDPAPLVAQAKAWRHLADYQLDHGTDPTHAAEASIRLGQRALERSASDVRAHHEAGAAYCTLGEYLTGKGDPREAFQEAIEHARKALAIDPGSLGGYRLICRAYNARGVYETMHGGDARPFFSPAVDAMKKAIALASGQWDLWNTIGYSHWGIGVWETSHGRDPAGAFTQALDEFTRVTELSPTLDYGYDNLCELQLSWSEFELARGGDPRPRLEQAIAHCEHAIRLDGDYPGTHLHLGEAYLGLAGWQLEHRIDPSDAIERSRKPIERALALDPGNGEALDAIGRASLLLARQAAQSSRDPRPSFAAAEQSVRRALAASNGRSAAALSLLAELARRRAEWRLAHHANIDADVRDGLGFARQALEENPTLVEAVESQGALHLAAAHAATLAKARAAAAALAQSAFARALELDSNLEHEIRPLFDEAARLASVE